MTHAARDASHGAAAHLRLALLDGDGFPFVSAIGGGLLRCAGKAEASLEIIIAVERGHQKVLPTTGSNGAPSLACKQIRMRTLGFVPAQRSATRRGGACRGCASLQADGQRC